MKEFCNRGWKYLSQMEDIFPHGGATGINAFHGAMTVPSQQNKETTSVLLQPIPSSMQTPVPTYMLPTTSVGQTDLSIGSKQPLSDPSPSDSDVDSSIFSPACPPHSRVSTFSTHSGQQSRGSAISISKQS